MASTSRVNPVLRPVGVAVAVCSVFLAGCVVTSDTVPSDTVPSDTGPSNTGPSNTGPSNTVPLTSDRRPDERATESGQPSDRLVEPEGFERRAARLTYADGTDCELCVWIAATDRQRRQGLMGVTDLGDADAMAFVYPDVKRRSFWMKDTLLHLAIVYVAGDGAVTEMQTMPPCEHDPCPTYRPGQPFAVAVEFAASDAQRFEIGTAVRFDLTGDPCPLG